MIYKHINNIHMTIKKHGEAFAHRAFLLVNDLSYRISVDVVHSIVVARENYDKRYFSPLWSR